MTWKSVKKVDGSSVIEVYHWSLNSSAVRGTILCVKFIEKKAKLQEDSRNWTDYYESDLINHYSPDINTMAAVVKYVGWVQRRELSL